MGVLIEVSVKLGVGEWVGELVGVWVGELVEEFVGVDVGVLVGGAGETTGVVVVAAVWVANNWQGLVCTMR